MPLDPNIPLAVTRPKILTPLEHRADALAVQRAEQQNAAGALELDAAEQARRDAAAIRQALEESRGDWRVALPRIRQIAPTAALEIEQKLGEARQRAAATIKAEMDAEGVAINRGLSLLRAIPEGDAELYDRLRPVLAETIPDLGAVLPETYDPDRLAQIQSIGLTAKDAVEAQRAGLERILKGEWRVGLGTVLSTATDQAEWDEMLAGFRELGAPESELAPFGPRFSPEAAQRAGALAMTPAERALAADRAADNARAAQTFAETVRHNRATEATAQGNLAARRAEGATGGAGGAEDPLVAAVLANPAIYAGLTPTAKTKIAPALQAAGFDFQQSAKPATGMQKRVFGFFNRAKQSDDELAALEDQIAGMGYLGQKWMQNAPNVLQTTAGQQYQQAQRAWTEARLRKDSGAAIPNHEFESDALTYFVQPGDGPDVIEQKRRARAAMLASLAFESGSAFGEFYGDEAPALLASYRERSRAGGAAAAAEPSGAATAPNLSGLKAGQARKFTSGPFAGQTWTVGPDGRPVRVS